MSAVKSEGGCQGGGGVGKNGDNGWEVRVGA